MLGLGLGISLLKQTGSPITVMQQATLWLEDDSQLVIYYKISTHQEEILSKVY